MNLFQQKRCMQCGWELGMFTKKKFCSSECANLWDEDAQDYRNVVHRKALSKAKDLDISADDMLKYQEVVRKLEEKDET